MNVSMLLYCIIGNVITLVCQLFSQHFEVIFDALLASVNIYFISFYRIEWLYRYNFTILGCDLYAFITFLYVGCLEYTSLQRISICLTMICGNHPITQRHNKWSKNLAEVCIIFTICSSTFFTQYGMRNQLSPYPIMYYMLAMCLALARISGFIHHFPITYVASHNSMFLPTFLIPQKKGS